ncbi:MAG TPA: tRNA dihydrouridine synthase DusB [Bacteroidales bacterium]|nr:tRNA dihydrouridine synthase DusB [Bacteroidales bacterium]
MAQFPFLTVDFPVFLAPMEEVSDSSFRAICKSFGADVVISEFVSSEAIIRDVDKSKRKLIFHEDERPYGIQIFGNNRDSLCRAAEISETYHPDFIDINWGCPVKKIVTKGAGSAILKDIPKMVSLTEAVVQSVKLPVTVKTRLGWDETNQPIVEIAERLQDVGIQMLTIHGRTRSQFYKGTADWTLIGKVKNNPRIFIPIVGNGDIDSGEKALQYKNEYGVDALMVGRAAIGNPFIFDEIRQVLAGKCPNVYLYRDKLETCLKQLRSAAAVKGEKKAVLEMRRHYSGYFKGVSHFKEKKIGLMQAQSIEECENILIKDNEL